MRIIKILIGAVLLWSLYWFAAGYVVRAGISGWFAAQSGRGWQAEYAEIRSSGYPVLHATTLRNPALADPATGAAWRADWLVIESPAIWPGRQVLHFPATPQRLSYLDQTVVITADALTARLFLAPGRSLEVEELAVQSGGWLINSDQGPVVAADSLIVAMVQSEVAEVYGFEIDATEFAPGLSLRRAISSSTALPDSFETLRLEMSVTFDRAWDRLALEERRPQPRRIELRLADAHWGELRLRAAGVLDVDDQGIPTGDVTIKADNWREMLQMAQAARALSPQAAQGAERVFGMLAGLGNNPEALEVRLSFRDGVVAIGPLPLGPAPRIVLR
jgi:hypothetical protein